MNNTIYGDTELLDGLAKDDRESIKQIYKLYKPMLTKWILTRGGLEDDADDIFQEGVLIIYHKAKLPEFCLTSKLSTYLFAICKRLWYKKSLVNNNTIHLDPTPEEGHETLAVNYDEDLEAHLEKEKNFKLLDKALDQLGGSCSELLKAFYLGNKSMIEIAQDFGYTNAENAKTQKYKCLTRLKKIFFYTSNSEV